MKSDKFSYLVAVVSDTIAKHEYKNMHYLRNSDIIKMFPQFKEKHVRRAIKEVR